MPGLVDGIAIRMHLRRNSVTLINMVIMVHLAASLSPHSDVLTLFAAQEPSPGYGKPGLFIVS